MGVKAGLILNMMISRIRRRSGLPLPPSYSPLWYVRHTLSRGRRVAGEHPKYMYTYIRATATRCVHARCFTHTLLHVSPPSLHRNGTCAPPPLRGLMYVPPFSVLRLLPSLFISVRLRKRDEKRDVTCFFTLFVIFFLCGVLNRLLVRVGVCTSRSVVPPSSEMFRYVCRGGFRRLIEREPSKCPRDCEGSVLALDNYQNRPATTFSLSTRK